jgi:hypothetical protein
MARLAWICIAAIGWDCPGVAGMARWACNVAAGMDRHDQVGVKPRGRHGVARSGCASAASQVRDGLSGIGIDLHCVAGLARHGNALHGLLRQAWQRTPRRGRAGMARQGLEGCSVAGMACPGGARSGRVGRHGAGSHGSATSGRHGASCRGKESASLCWSGMACYRRPGWPGEVTTAR